LNNVSCEGVKRIARFRLGTRFLEIENGLHCIPKALKGASKKKVPKGASEGASESESLSF
jgi:hypothetical protein